MVRKWLEILLFLIGKIDGMAFKSNYRYMALLIHLWDDFSAECQKRGIRPEYQMFSIWLEGVSPATKKKFLQSVSVEPVAVGDNTQGENNSDGNLM